jgi:phosphotransferase system HPr (HPr) family protein
MPNKTATCRARLTNDHGLHLRAAMVLSERARQFACGIQVTCGDRRADVKSILDLISLTATCGSELLFEAQGLHSAQAVRSLQQLVQEEFGSPEPPGVLHDHHQR